MRLTGAMQRPARKPSCARCAARQGESLRYKVMTLRYKVRGPVALRVLQVEDSRITGHDERSRLARRPAGVPQGTPGGPWTR